MTKCKCGSSESGMYFRGAYYCPLCLPAALEAAGPNYKRQPIRSVKGGDWEPLPVVGEHAKGETDGHV